MGYRKSIWTKEKILEAIRSLHAAGEDLTPLTMRRANSRVMASALTHFGSWRRAVEAAGFDYEAVRRRGLERRVQTITKWTPESILREVQRLWESGQDLRSSSVHTRLPGLHAAARRIYGSWGEVLKATGIPAQSVRETLRTHYGWKRKWLGNLTRQAGDADSDHPASGRDYQAILRQLGATTDEGWLQRLGGQNQPAPRPTKSTMAQ